MAIKCDPSESTTRRRCFEPVSCLKSSCAEGGGVIASHSPTTNIVEARIAAGSYVGLSAAQYSPRSFIAPFGERNTGGLRATPLSDRWRGSRPTNGLPDKCFGQSASPFSQSTDY